MNELAGLNLGLTFLATLFFPLSFLRQALIYGSIYTERRQNVTKFNEERANFEDILGRCTKITP